MIQLHFHQVTRIELASEFVANGNSRTVRIVARDYNGNDTEIELIVYGNTDALDTLPKADDFRSSTFNAEASEF